MSTLLIIAVLVVVAVGVMGCLALAVALVCWFIRDLRKDQHDLR